MSFFRKEQLFSNGIFNGLTDYHSHILPGVDDGVRTMEKSLAALSYMESLGVRELWMTPHIMEDIPNSPSQLREIFNDVQAEYKGGMKLRLAAENMLDNLFSQRLKEGDLLPIGEDLDMLLVETSFFNPPTGFMNILGAIKSAGLIPLLAHPEKYDYLDKDDYLRLGDMGVRFQINLVSLAGANGRIAKKKADWFAKKGLIYVYGSDFHHLHIFDRNIHLKF